ncbi:uncharacterized protein PEZ65_006411 [Lycodopsis pacificus]
MNCAAHFLCVLRFITCCCQGLKGCVRIKRECTICAALKAGREKTREFLSDKSNFTKIKDKMASKQGQGLYAEGYSVATARDIKDLKGKNLNLKVVTGGGDSVLCADKVSGVTVEGDLDFSVNTSPAGAGPKKN